MNLNDFYKNKYYKYKNKYIHTKEKLENNVDNRLICKAKI